MMAKRKEAIRKIGNEEKNMGRGERKIIREIQHELANPDPGKL